MKRFRLLGILTGCLIAAVLATLSAAQRGADCPNKVLVCHLTASGVYEQIWVGPDKVEWHLSHGDCLGACPCVVNP